MIKRNSIQRIIVLGICLFVSLHTLIAQSESPTPSINFSVFGGKLFTNEEAAHLYTDSIGGGAEISTTISNLRLLANGQVFTAKSNNVWTDSYTILSATGGLGYTIQTFKHNEIAATCKYGVIIHYNGSTWYLNQRGEIGLRLCHQTSAKFCPFLEGNVVMMFATPDNTILYNGTVGIQYEI